MNEPATVPQCLKATVERFGDKPFQGYKNEQGVFQLITYKEFYQIAGELGAGLRGHGIERGDRVGILSDNRKEWLMINLAILGIGALDVPRGTDTNTKEAAYIYQHSGAKALVVENDRQLIKIIECQDQLSDLELIIYFDEEKIAELTAQIKKPKIICFDELKKAGQKKLSGDPDFFEREILAGKKEDPASLLYTSGTTGIPKGVLLTQENYVFQFSPIKKRLDFQEKDSFINVLPVWHAYERVIEYVIIYNGLTMYYSKPVGQILLADMAAVNPRWMASVPRIWEGIYGSISKKMRSSSPIVRGLFYFAKFFGERFYYFYNRFTGRYAQLKPRQPARDRLFSILPLLFFLPGKALGDLLVFRKIRKKLGNNFIAGVSGGGALPPYVDNFFQAAGILLLEGYGLTETAPVLAVRRRYRPIHGTIGPLLDGVEHRILDENEDPVPKGEKGILWIKSRQIMREYYKEPELTGQTIKNGWLNTGDLAVETFSGELKLFGRIKETIVLTGGENVEPVPIEEKICESLYVSQVMVVGQDKHFLAALVVADQEMIEEYARQHSIIGADYEELVKTREIQTFVYNEIAALINPKAGFRIYEMIARVHLLTEPFKINRELTATLKIRRDVVNELYGKEIENLFH